MSLNKRLDDMINEHVVTFTKEEMATLHNDGKLVKKDEDGKDHTYLYKEMDEMSSTSGGEAYNTPFAFSKKKKTKKVKESKFMSLAKSTLMSEISYKEYKSNDESTQKQKVNRAVREINSKLYKIEGFINQNIKLKTEAGIDQTKYWKSTRSNLQKISEKMVRISERLRRF